MDGGKDDGTMASWFSIFVFLLWEQLLFLTQKNLYSAVKDILESPETTRRGDIAILEISIC